MAKRLTRREQQEIKEQAKVEAVVQKQATGERLTRREQEIVKRIAKARKAVPEGEPFDPRTEAIKYTTMAFPKEEEKIPEVFRETPREYYARAVEPKEKVVEEVPVTAAPPKERVPYGEIRPAEPIKGVMPRISVAEAKLEQYALREKAPFKRQLYGVGAYGLGVAGVFVGMGRAITRPIETVKGMYYTVTHPAEVGTQIGIRMKERPSAFAGTITGLAVAPKLISKVEAYVAPRVTGIVRTIGKKKIPVEKIVPGEVIVGKERFPVAPPKEHLRIFKKAPYKLPGTKEPVMFHAAPRPIKGRIVGPGESEFLGIYGAPGISPHFLKIAKPEIDPLKIGLGLPGRPKVAAITPTKFIKGKKAPPGVAFVPGVKAEVEAILPPGTEFIKGKTPYYFKWEGVRVPIQKVGVAPMAIKAPPGIVVPKAMKAVDLGREYYLPPTYPSVTAESLLVSVVAPFAKPRKEIIKEERIVEPKPSRIISPISPPRVARPISYLAPRKAVRRPTPTYRKPYVPSREIPREIPYKPLVSKPYPILEEPYRPLMRVVAHPPYLQPLKPPKHEEAKPFKLPALFGPQPRAYTASLYGITFLKPIPRAKIPKFFTGAEPRPAVKRKKRKKRRKLPAFFDF